MSDAPDTLDAFRRSDAEFYDAFAVALVVGGSIVIPHLRRAVVRLEEPPAISPRPPRAAEAGAGAGARRVSRERGGPALPGADLSVDRPRRSGRAARPPCARADRKSTRLNSSHGYISYAVF